jgi:hypothetical protein
MRTNALIVGLLVLGCHVGSTAGAANLRWKFRGGETLHYVMDQKTVTSVKGGPQEFATTVNQTIELEWVVKDVQADNVANLTQKITRLRTKIESPFGPAFEYDSKAAKDPQGPIAAGLIPLLKALIGAEFSFKMSPHGELTDVQVPESVVKAIREAGPLAGAGGMFTADGLKHMVTESSLTLPKEDLAKGKSWSRQSKLPMAKIGAMQLDKAYTYQGPEAHDGKDMERIDLDVKIDIQRTPETELDVNLKSQNGKGSFFFDNAAGHIADSAVNEKIEMVFKVMDKEITQGTETTTTMKLAKTDASGSSTK